MKYLALIWAGLWRRPTRTSLAMLSIVAAFVLFGLLQGVNEGIKIGLGDSDNRRLWTVSRMSSVGSLPISLVDQIKAIQGVRAVADISFFGGYFQNARNALPAYATHIHTLAQVYPDLHISQAQVEAMSNVRTGAVVGRPLADKYHWKVGDRVPIGSTLWANTGGSSSWEFDIVGIFDPAPQYARTSLGKAFWINYDYWDQLRTNDPHRVHQFVIEITDPSQVAVISAEVDQLFKNSPQETLTRTENAAIQAQVQRLADINFIANAIVGAVMFTLLLLTGNIMMQSMRERIPELAVLKAVGFSSALVFGFILAESLLLNIFAAVAGMLLSVFAIRFIGAELGTGTLPTIVVIAGIGIAAALALVSGLPAAIQAQRLSVVGALADR